MAITRSQQAMIDVLDILNLHFPVLVQRRKRRKTPTRPSHHAALLKRLWRAGIRSYPIGGGSGTAYAVRDSLFPGIAITGLNTKVLEEIIAILQWADKPTPEGDPPEMSDHLKAEVEEIMGAMYIDKPFDPDNPSGRKTAPKAEAESEGKE